MLKIFLTQNFGKCPLCSGTVRGDYSGYYKCNDCTSVFKVIEHGQTDRELHCIEIKKEISHEK